MSHLILKFEEKWATHPDCEMIIQTSWEADVLPGSPMARLFEKIKRCRFALLDWSRATFGHSQTQLKEKEQRLEELCQLNNADHVNTIKELKGEISTLIHQEELAWRQRSRSIWLPAGDKNTKYFHQRASQRRRKNQILGVLDSEGNWCTSEDRIAQVAESYFQNLFTSAHSNNIDSVLRTVERRITPQMNDNLTQRYTTKEVRYALFQMHPSKSPGPDGMSPFFFQKYWHIVGTDVQMLFYQFYILAIC